MSGDLPRRLKKKVQFDFANTFKRAAGVYERGQEADLNIYMRSRRLLPYPSRCCTTAWAERTWEQWFPWAPCRQHSHNPADISATCKPTFRMPAKAPALPWFCAAVAPSLSLHKEPTWMVVLKDLQEDCGDALVCTAGGKILMYPSGCMFRG